MNRLFATVLLFLSFAAGAVTIEPLPGSAPQTANAGAYFRQPIGVIVRDDAGAPIAGASVQFVADTYAGAPGVMFLGTGFGFATTDANGLAVLSDGVVALDRTGDVVLHVLHPQATIDLAPLTIVGLPPRRLNPVGGDQQAAYPGEFLGAGFSSVSLDANDNPVPYAFVMFESTPFGSFPATVSWDGEGLIWLMADENTKTTSGRTSRSTRSIQCSSAG